jgi:hypothetical protein
MFDIKNLGIRDYIICGLLLVVSFLIYKYFTNSNKIKSLEDEINDLNNKIILNKEFIDNNITNKNFNYESDSNDDYTADDTINYKTGKTLETFNNTIKDVKGYKTSLSTHIGSSLLDQNSNRLNLFDESMLKQNNIECNDNFCYIKKPVNNKFEQKIDNLSNEVDNIIKSDVYIPIDLKQIINNVYDFPEINEEDTNDEDSIDEDYVDEEEDYNNNNFNPIIINNEIKITQDDIENNKIIQIPDFINLPITLEQNSKEFELPSDMLEKSLDSHTIILDETNNNSLDKNEITLNEITLNEITLNEITLNKIVLDEKQDNLDIELNKISKEEESVDKIKNMKINDIKNLAKEFNIKVTENGRPKSKDQLVKEINNHKNITSNI